MFQLGLHIDTTESQCQMHNNSLRRVLPVGAAAPTVINAQYGIVFTGETCLVGQLGNSSPHSRQR